jgi:hypothetical protein
VDIFTKRVQVQFYRSSAYCWDCGGMLD